MTLRDVDNVGDFLKRKSFAGIKPKSHATLSFQPLVTCYVAGTLPCGQVPRTDHYVAIVSLLSASRVGFRFCPETFCGAL